MILPTVHLNGTSRDDLVEQRLGVIRALCDVEKALQAAWPHGRDYYPQGPDALNRAQQEWADRLDVLVVMREEVEEEAHQIRAEEVA